MGEVGLSLPVSGSMVTAKLLASTPADFMGSIISPWPRQSVLNMPHGMGGPPSAGISHNSYAMLSGGLARLLAFSNTRPLSRTSLVLTYGWTAVLAATSLTGWASG